MDVNTLALVNSLRKKISLLERRQREALSQRKAELEQEVNGCTQRLKKQASANRLLEQMIGKIRQSLDLEQILETAVQQIQEFLDVPQVVIYKVFDQDFETMAIAKPKFQEKEPELNQILTLQEEKATIAVTANPAQKDACAELMIPIEQESKLWGFIYVYDHERIGNWNGIEIESLERLSTQIAIALQQAQLYQSSRQAENALIELNQELEQRVKQRTKQLEQVNAKLHNQLQEKIRAEHQLKTTNEQLQAVIDAVPGFISWINSDLTYLGVNKRLACALNLPPEKFMNQEIGFIDNRQEFGQFIQRFFKNTREMIAQTIIKNYVNDEVHYYLLVAQKYNQGKAAVSVGIDITENKKLEQELHKTFSQLKTLISNLRLGIILKDRQRNVLFVNQTFCDLFEIEISPEDLIGKSHSEFQSYYYPKFQDPDQVEKRNNEILAKQEPINSEEWVLNSNLIIERDYIPIIIDNLQEGSLWVYQDITDHKCYEKELENSLEQKEMLLKEIHHRVKNNLLVVSNLLEFQTDYTDDPEVIAVLEESQSRIQSMALIHEKLYRSTGLDRIDFGEYLEALIDNLFESYNVSTRNIDLDINVESIFLNIETANPCGLIVNELVSNAFKHAFPNGRKGTIWISLSKDETQKITLTVRDNGVGLPKDLDPKDLDSLGLDLVWTLTQQLKGNLTVTQEQGTCFSLTFSERNYHKRYSAK